MRGGGSRWNLPVSEFVVADSGIYEMLSFPCDAATDLILSELQEGSRVKLWN